jgi:hypothetical protein
VYIRGTAPQTQVAIRYISEYFGGRPALSTDEMIVSTPDYTAVTVPNAALSFIFNGDYNCDWFPSEGKVTIGDVPVFLEPMVGEAMMRLIFEGPGAPFAMDAVMNSLRVWQSLTQQGDTSFLSRKTATLNALSRQTTPEVQDPDSGSESKYIHNRSSSLDSASEKVSTISEPEVVSEVTNELDEISSDVEDGICGIVFVLTSSSVNWFMSSNDETGKNFVSELMATTKCYVQVLPASCCRISKCVEVKKIAVIAPSKAVRKAAMERVVKHILTYREAAVPALPIQAVLRKFCHNKEYSNARYAGNRVKHPAMSMGRNNVPGNGNGGAGHSNGNGNHYNGGYQSQQMPSGGQQPQFQQMPYSFGPGAAGMGGMRQMQQPAMQQQMQQIPSPSGFMSTNYGGHGSNGLGLNLNTDSSSLMMDRGNRMERSPGQQQSRKPQVQGQPQLQMDSMQHQQHSMPGMGVGLNLGLGMGYGQPMAGNADLYTSSNVNSYFIPALPSHDLPVYSNAPANINSVPSNNMPQYNLMGRKATY